MLLSPPFPGGNLWIYQNDRNIPISTIAHTTIPMTGMVNMMKFALFFLMVWKLLPLRSYFYVLGEIYFNQNFKKLHIESSVLGVICTKKKKYIYIYMYNIFLPALSYYYCLLRAIIQIISWDSSIQCLVVLLFRVYHRRRSTFCIYLQYNCVECIIDNITVCTIRQ